MQINNNCVPFLSLPFNRGSWKKKKKSSAIDYKYAITSMNFLLLYYLPSKKNKTLLLYLMRNCIGYLFEHHHIYHFCYALITIYITCENSCVPKPIVIQNSLGKKRDKSTSIKCAKR